MIDNRMIKSYEIQRLSQDDHASQTDLIAIEEPLEIQLAYSTQSGRMQKTVAIVMRTPGDDAALARGFIFTEGICSIYGLKHAFVKNKHDANSLLIELEQDIVPVLQLADRNFYSNSSCGVCGKTSIDTLNLLSPFENLKDDLLVDAELIKQLPNKLRKYQPSFGKTGGMHGCGIFDTDGNCLMVKEDVGRHNALDKLIGSNLDKLPMKDTILVLSGRTSFEMLQKAAMAGCRMIVAVGAPSSLAIDLAIDHGITLIGFTNATGFNMYSHAHRVN
jgi:FdhD protein